ncbi:MAG: DNA repair protein RecO [Actinomycetaceae bacterium]|nr:DNA repair protein RecO [Actinomycetaceae bacterium]MDY6142932.1 DNA repair protein RecO [Arcanobacterium sp.]
MNKTYRDQVIVLYTYPIGEADRVITMLSREHGKIRAVAKGVRKTKSRFGARLEPFSLIDAQFYIGRTLDVVTQVESLNEYHRAIVTNYERYTAGCAILETADQLVADEGVPDLANFVLLHGAIHALAAGAHAPHNVLNSYILRAMSYAGWQLAIFECAVCGAPGPHDALSVGAGGAVCSACRPPASTIPSVETWQLLGALSVGDWSIVDASDATTQNSAAAIISAYLQYQLEHGINSLKYVNARMIS